MKKNGGEILGDNNSGELKFVQGYIMDMYIYVSKVQYMESCTLSRGLLDMLWRIELQNSRDILIKARTVHYAVNVSKWVEICMDNRKSAGMIMGYQKKVRD
ncbi:predicted protein [Histoplasma capsulatum var. duboisii H88]|uniref:Predicted protein n=1 Tax=Ajellomyces capsulatus (strain H88) TaxID=544711 RepID=F0USK7_AJEC8|nr:predicted protein [Histoplasma capsulatum var. duboisii H88]